VNQQKQIDGNLSDCFLSHDAIPNCDLILQGTKLRRKGARQREPYFSHEQLERYLEFLEYVVTTERIIVPIANYSRKVEKCLRSRSNEFFFTRYYLGGDLDLRSNDIQKVLVDKGILIHAQIASEFSSIDEFVDNLAPKSNFLKKRFRHFREQALSHGSTDPELVARSAISHFHGLPIHTSHVATHHGISYTLANFEIRDIAGYEREVSTVKRTVGKAIAERFNSGARAEISRISAATMTYHFPLTPIAAYILNNSHTPLDMLETAIALRKDFSGYRAYVFEMQRELSSESTSLKSKEMRLKELAHVISSLWPQKETKGGTRRTVQLLAFSAIEASEIITNPGIVSTKKVIDKILELPLDRLMLTLKTRKTRVLLKAKKELLTSKDTTRRLATIFDVPVDLIVASRGVDASRASAAR
jgi:hypothetical protein